MTSSQITTSSGGNPIVSRIYNATNHHDLSAIYDEWATKYNQDLSDQDYQAPTYVAEAVAHHSKRLDLDLSNAVAFDAGCGTGLSGIALKKITGIEIIDGVDLSPGMLDVARETDLYRNLEEADLSKAIPSTPNEAYDVVICVGTLTHAHVGPDPALGEFVRIVKKGKGLVVATIIDDVWESMGFKDEVQKLEREGVVEVLGVESLPYRRAAGVNAKVLVLRRV